jgi:hypothetical protein
MGTRSLTFVYEDNKAIINMYRQFDGYPEGHGQELADFLGQFAAITNGIRVGETRKTANGMGCLAAQLVANFKTEVGGFYLYPTSAKDCGQEYEYHVYQDKVVIKDYDGNQLFRGTWPEFNDFCYGLIDAE